MKKQILTFALIVAMIGSIGACSSKRMANNIGTTKRDTTSKEMPPPPPPADTAAKRDTTHH